MEYNTFFTSDYSLSMTQICTNLYLTRSLFFDLYCDDDTPSFEVFNYRGSDGDYSSTMVSCLQVFQKDSGIGKESALDYKLLKRALNKPSWILKSITGKILEESYIYEEYFHRTNGPAKIINAEDGTSIEKTWVYHGNSYTTMPFVKKYCQDNGLNMNDIPEEDAIIMYNIKCMKGDTLT